MIRRKTYFTDCVWLNQDQHPGTHIKVESVESQLGLNFVPRRCGVRWSVDAWSVDVHKSRRRIQRGGGAQLRLRLRMQDMCRNLMGI
jgi:hypothetical protein